MDQTPIRALSDRPYRKDPSENPCLDHSIGPSHSLLSGDFGSTLSHGRSECALFHRARPLSLPEQAPCQNRSNTKDQSLSSGAARWSRIDNTFQSVEQNSEAN